MRRSSQDDAAVETLDVWGWCPPLLVSARTVRSLPSHGLGWWTSLRASTISSPFSAGVFWRWDQSKWIQSGWIQSGTSLVLAGPPLCRLVPVGPPFVPAGPPVLVFNEYFRHLVIVPIKCRWAPRSCQRPPSIRLVGLSWKRTAPTLGSSRG